MNRAVAQLVAHTSGGRGVGGSNPPSPKIHHPQHPHPSAKSDTRRRVRRALADLTEHARNTAAATVESALSASSAWLEASVILAFASLPSEIDTTRVLRSALLRHVLLGLPRVSGQELSFHLVEDLSDLQQGHLGVREPSVRAPRWRPEPLAGPLLILVPGVAFTAAGGRLGRGGGHYDRFLASLPPALPLTVVGLCFACQLLPDLPLEPHDRMVDAVVTEAGVHGRV